MGPIDIAVIVVVGVAFAAVIGTMIYKKIKGKSSGCACGCEGCPHCGGCGKR